ncbi:MAG: glycosyltransferase family 2 protein [Bacteroidales bacterium]|nr:glycosyltransferase family 2 protein [Bacteroidales bacterium]
MPYFSVVTPVYGCKTSLYELYFRLTGVLETLNTDYEIIMVNDASPDGAWDTILEFANKDKRVKGINLSRNFGQHYAITAGLDHCNGEWVVVMDCDLQDQPEEIVKLYNKAKEGFDIVLARREKRKDTFFKRFWSYLFYKALSYFTDTKQDRTIANFGIYKYKVIESISRMEDNVRYFPTMVHWVGFRKIEICVEHCYRVNGKSSYNFKSLLNLAFNNIIAFSNKPLKLVIKFGFLIVFTSILFAFYNLLQYFKGNIIVTGYTSLIISIWFLSGIIISVIGIVGIYIGQIFDKIKQRPMYIISDKLNL